MFINKRPFDAKQARAAQLRAAAESYVAATWCYVRDDCLRRVREAAMGNEASCIYNLPVFIPGLPPYCQADMLVALWHHALKPMGYTVYATDMEEGKCQLSISWPGSGYDYDYAGGDEEGASDEGATTGSAATTAASDHGESARPPKRRRGGGGKKHLQHKKPKKVEPSAEETAAAEAIRREANMLRIKLMGFGPRR